MSMSWRMPTPRKVLECIEDWRSHDLRTITDDEIEKLIHNLIDELGDYVVAKKEFHGHRPLFRVRETDKTYPWSNQQDFFHPPAEIARRNRCNRPNEPVLYCCEKAFTAIEETSPRCQFVLIKYQTKGSWKLSQVVGAFDPNPKSGPPVLIGNDLLASQVLREFIRSEFTKPAGPETEFLYKISTALCRTWFDATDDGWIYPSVAVPSENSIAIKPSTADRILEVQGAWLMETIAQDNPDVYEVQVLQALGEGWTWQPPPRDHCFIWKSGNLQFHNSESSKK